MFTRTFADRSADGAPRARRRGGLAAMLAVAVLIATAGSAFGAAPVHTQDTLFWEDEVIAECDGFDILATSQDLRRNIVTWYGEDGDAVRQRRMVHYDFTFVNTTTGATAEYIGHFDIAEDYVAETTTLFGANRQLWRDGRLVMQVAGKTVFSPDGETSVGHSSLGEFEEALCDAMA